MTYVRLTKNEYEFLTNTGHGKDRTAVSNALIYCKEHGLFSYITMNGVVYLTPAGKEAVKAYQANDSYKRIDVI